MIVLGIDPGTAIVGYSVLQTTTRGTKPKVLDFGCIITDKSRLPGDRLNIIYDQVMALIKKHKPDLLSIEALFFFKNAKTVMPVSQSKGVILLAAAKNKISVQEFTPLQIKMTVVGYGRAEKKQIQGMTEQLLDLSDFDMTQKDRKKDDAADALAVALCATLHTKW